MKLSTLTTFGACLLAALVAADPQPNGDITNRPSKLKEQAHSGDFAGTEEHKKRQPPDFSDSAEIGRKREEAIAAGEIDKRQPPDSGDSAEIGRKREEAIGAGHIDKRQPPDSGDSAEIGRKREETIAAGHIFKRHGHQDSGER